MEKKVPGVNVVDNRIISVNDMVESAVPLFIGFTQKRTSLSAVFISSFSDYEINFGGQHAGDAILYYAIKHFFDNGGVSGYVFSLGSYDEFETLTSFDICNLLQSKELSHTVAAEQSITLLAFPDCIVIPNDDIYSWHKVWDRLIALAGARSGIFAILDAPGDPDNAAKCISNYSGNEPQYGAAWWPYLVTSYLKGNSPIVITPSASVIAAIQVKDASHGVWSAPANVSLVKVIRPLYSWLEGHHFSDENCQALNIIRSFPGKGTRIWGCRTLTQDIDSQYRYVQIRRFISWCEKNITDVCRMFLFEPNNEITWYKLKGVITNWLRKVWYQGGLYGVHESDAFQVLLGIDESMSEIDIQDGRLVIIIRLAVLYPAEFINLTIDLKMNAVQ